MRLVFVRNRHNYNIPLNKYGKAVAIIEKTIILKTFFSFIFIKIGIKNIKLNNVNPIYKLGSE